VNDVPGHKTRDMSLRVNSIQIVFCCCFIFIATQLISTIIFYMFHLILSPSGISEKMKDTTTSDLSSVCCRADSGQQSPVLQENIKNTSIRKLWGK